MPRRLQFSLKWLFMATAAAAAIAAAMRWHANRLGVLCESYIALIHEERFVEAEKVAARARRLYPNELVAEQLERNSKLFKALFLDETGQSDD